MNSKLSAVIITFNEERNIQRCIESLLPVADEIIVVDSFSTDRTEEICKLYGIRFFQNQWLGYAQTKNFANEHATCTFILSIDADEVLTLELQEEIQNEKKNGFSGIYELNRLTNYCGNWIYYSGWFPDLKIRIFPKEGSQWSGGLVHEELAFSKKLPKQKLKGLLHHYSYYSSAEHKNRADRYSKLTAKKYFENGKKAHFFSPFFSAILRFLSMFFLKFGFLDGFPGFKIAYISAQSNYLKYKELRRLNREHGGN